MSTPAQSDLFAERVSRLRKILELNAPDSMIVTEVHLVAEAWHGSPGRFLLAAAWYAAAAWWSWHVSFPLSRLLCRLNLRHDDDRDGFGCLWCGKDADLTLLAALEGNEEP